MTFNQITLKNLKSNFKNYALYLFSLIFSIILYFSFVTLQYTHSINNGGSPKVIQEGAKVGAVFLFITIIIFLMYANQLFIKRRTREFALFQLIGLTRQNILRMLAIEQLTFFIITGIIGILVGIVGSELLLNILVKMMHLKVDVSIGFELPALIQTIVMLILAFILIMFQNYLFLKRRTILSMMKDSTKSEATKSKITVPELIAGILGIVMIILGYYISTEMFGKFQGLTMALVTPFLILFLTVVGAYLFFRSSVSIIFKSLKKSKHGRVSITDVVFTSSIMHRMKKNAMSLTIIAIISAITVTILCFGAISKANTDYMIQTSSPQDINFTKSQSAQKYEQLLKQHHIQYDTKTLEGSNTKLLKNDVLKSKTSNGIQNAGVIVMSDAQIKGNHATITNTQGPLSGMVSVHTDNDMTLQGQQKVTLLVNQKNDNEVIPSNVSIGGPVLKVSPDVYNKLKLKDQLLHHYGFDIKHHQDISKAEKLAKKVSPTVALKSDTKQMLDESNGILMFVTSFLGLAFLIAAGCIIYIKQMDETEDEINNYRILRRIGFTHTDMMKGLALKILFNFGLPLIIALLHALFAALVFMKLMGEFSPTPIIIVMIVYSLVYLIFAVISFVHANRIVKHAI
ncbi:FtsX-like permease family protein [Staphylococcus sp. GDY8P57P]|uniref:FtsX-like permease family protein n=1 Tax=Staphylococcus sp. GDY8P57P TaxID=2804128 RepID=UPI00187FBAD1|nr:FtsX-like permease family protein [Staphylococcus sp. GDY8P57P]MBF2757982.1 FtsX-like permease family protein [Staphylococcus haemolyticus]MBF2772390.1 FtsX-like permease family protein [Staphylococcus haemolyticus]MBF2777229.1 FtsX-like permease family protein [Staphylococcus haemolyticus]MBF2816190.1 FtsX-like permease family protein [Staphylococcus haemolyticus]MBF9721387.1 FtsX-like permease family protein [Staphylococcus haemolyticus]